MDFASSKTSSMDLRSRDRKTEFSQMITASLLSRRNPGQNGNDNDPGSARNAGSHVPAVLAIIMNVAFAVFLIAVVFVKPR
jgi:hypothetical protein